MGCYVPPPQGVRMQQMRMLLVEPSAHRHTVSPVSRYESSHMMVEVWCLIYIGCFGVL